MAGRLAAWLAGWLVGRLAGWLGDLSAVHGSVAVSWSWAEGVCYRCSRRAAVASSPLHTTVGPHRPVPHTSVCFFLLSLAAKRENSAGETVFFIGFVIVEHVVLRDC